MKYNCATFSAILSNEINAKFCVHLEHTQCVRHRHEGCKLASEPKSNTAFWKSKFNQNVERDKRNIAELEALGWSVGIIWECSLRNGSFMEQPLVQFITSRNSWVISS